jgi:hypothetical protein
MSKTMAVGDKVAWFSSDGSVRRGFVLEVVGEWVRALEATAAWRRAPSTHWAKADRFTPVG